MQSSRRAPMVNQQPVETIFHGFESPMDTMVIFLSRIWFENMREGVHSIRILNESRRDAVMEYVDSIRGTKMQNAGTVTGERWVD